jgi:hypothetical protein
VNLATAEVYRRLSNPIVLGTVKLCRWFTTFTLITNFWAVCYCRNVDDKLDLVQSVLVHFRTIAVRISLVATLSLASTPEHLRAVFSTETTKNNHHGSQPRRLQECYQKDPCQLHHAHKHSRRRQPVDTIHCTWYQTPRQYETQQRRSSGSL